jgi:hypothetical protein
MLFREIIAVFFFRESNEAHKYTAGKMQSYWMLKQVVHVDTMTLKD